MTSEPQNTQPINDPEAMDVDPPATAPSSNEGPSIPQSSQKTELPNGAASPPTSQPEQTSSERSKPQNIPKPQPTPEAASVPPWMRPEQPSAPPPTEKSDDVPPGAKAPPPFGGASRTSATASPPPKEDTKGKGKAEPAPESTAEAEADDDTPQVDLASLPAPDLNALLNKSREPGAHIEVSSFTVPELLAMVSRAADYKAEGNKFFTAKPPNLNSARDDYLRALDSLPGAVPKHLPAPEFGEERIREITDEEAEQIDADWRAGPERVSIENEIRDTQKALWGNLGAVYAAQKRDKEVVDACTRALRIDPTYIKALHRRATANEHLGSWTALVQAQNDYNALQALLPPDSTILIGVRKALQTLPSRIANARKRETADLESKLGGLATN